MNSIRWSTVSNEFSGHCLENQIEQLWIILSVAVWVAILGCHCSAILRHACSACALCLCLVLVLQHACSACAFCLTHIFDLCVMTQYSIAWSCCCLSQYSTSYCNVLPVLRSNVLGQLVKVLSYRNVAHSPTTLCSIVLRCAWSSTLYRII